jgi:bifunctional aspartokinase / homoserine dehydrogenase 1
VSDLLVMKFGGTSMGSAERMHVAAGLIAEQSARRPVVVVVSAMSKVTDLLLDSLRKAEAGDQADLDANLEKLLVRHRECCCGLLPKDRQPSAMAGVEDLIAEFARIAQGVLMLGERPPRSVDEAVAVGERLSAYLMALHMEA